MEEEKFHKIAYVEKSLTDSFCKKLCENDDLNNRAHEAESSGDEEALTARQPQMADLLDQAPEDVSEDDNEEEEHEPEPRKGKRGKKGDDGKLPPRKAIKKLIQKEMDKQSAEIFQDLMDRHAKGEPV